LMKRYILAAAFGIALLPFADHCRAGLITVRGVIDEVDFSSGNPAPFVVGDLFTATFYFGGRRILPGPGSYPIGPYTLSIGGLTTSGVADFGTVALSLDVSEHNLLYQVFQFFSLTGPPPYRYINADILIYDPAAGGIIPPFEQLGINSFSIDLTAADSTQDRALGHLTGFPTVLPTSTDPVPEKESSLTLLSLAVFGLAAVGVVRQRHRSWR